MADEQDDSQKTEEPTEKRLEEARKRGDVPRSQEAKHAVMLGAAALGLSVTAAWMVERLAGTLVDLLGHAERVSLKPGDGEALAMQLAGATLAAVAPLLLLLVVAAGLGGLTQGRPTISWDKVTPKFSKISPLAGFGRLFGMHGLVELIKNLAKLALVCAVVVAVLRPHLLAFETILGASSEVLLRLMLSLSIRLLLAVAVLVAVLAGADYFYQRLAFLKRMRMSLQELKDEYKQSEGDPHIKARIRQLRMERARKRMMAAVPTADVVITNPTHFAVALKYVQGAAGAPKVVAKGVDSLAARIRALATEHKVPIVENPPLARTLHASVDIDQEIKPEHYQAVAEVISYVLRLKRDPRLRPPRHS